MLLVHQLRVVLLELTAQGLVFRRNVVRVGRHEEQQHRVAFDVTQKPESQALAFRRSFNDARDVGHHKALVPAVGDHAQIGTKGGERIVRDLRLGRTHHAQKRGLSGVGKAHQTDVGKQLQLDDFPLLEPVLARLSVTRGLVGGRLEVVVPEAATSARGGDEFLAVLRDFSLDLARFGILDQRAKRHFNDLVLAVGTVLPVARTRLAVRGDHVPLVFEVQERPEVVVPANDHVTSTSAVASVRTALGGGLVAVHVRRALPPFSRAAADFDVVDEVLAGHEGPGSRVAVRANQAPMAAVRRAVMSSMDPTPSMPWYLPAAR